MLRILYFRMCICVLDRSYTASRTNQSQNECMVYFTYPVKCQCRRNAEWLLITTIKNTHTHTRNELWSKRHRLISSKKSILSGKIFLNGIVVSSVQTIHRIREGRSFYGSNSRRSTRSRHRRSSLWQKSTILASRYISYFSYLLYIYIYLVVTHLVSALYNVVVFFSNFNDYYY